MRKKGIWSKIKGKETELSSFRDINYHKIDNQNQDISPQRGLLKNPFLLMG